MSLTSWWRTPRVFLAPGLVLVLVAIGGRFTLDRAGFVDLAWVDLRVIGLIAALVLLTVDMARRPKTLGAYRPEGWLVATVLFFLFQIASGLWAPQASRVGPQTLDLVLMGVLTLAYYFYTVGDPAIVVRTTFLLFFVAAIVFALAALFINGPGDQGRYSAFGGGPNVFVRIEILGVISAIALYLFTRRILPLLVIPLFLLAAVLSGSRAGLLAGVAVGLAALWKIRRRLRTSFVVAALGVLVAATAVVWAFAPPAFTSLFQERFVEQTVEQHYLSDRTDIWAAAWRLAVEHPLAGAGLDGFYGLIGVNQAVEYPHNYVLGVAAEGGFLGMLLLTTAVVLWARTVRGGGVRPQLTGLGVAAAVFVGLSSLFSGDYYDARLFWLFAALAAGAAVVPAPAELADAQSREKAVVAR
ncbi:O-antigen ligase family protein [Actinoplanes friuliensis]|uniref:Putative O-antigen polymerase n=1 Tax=Actinoplanes friuliensis DSM 7358 TaxID=1246995 RepID=U5VUJ1_9ACTN|nr:O-antigen ligase family protein [Actinoplanes friuliensis]AGZ40628.1 putative O-antigen polymerase [Actinoplanes friuliensis DSM 7358]